MKTIRYLQHLLRGRNKQKVFLLGAYISFLVVMIISIVTDLSYGNTVDAALETFFSLITLLSLLHYFYIKNMAQAIDSIIIIVSLTSLALLWSNHTTILASYSLVPLAYFHLYSLRKALIYTGIYHSIATAIMIYEYFDGMNYPAMHDPAAVIAALMSSLMVILFGVVYHLSVERSYQLLVQSNRQKELLLKEVHHRVKNNLNIISSMLGLQMLREEDPRIRHIFEKNKYRIKSIALVHEILYRHSDFERIDVHEYLGQLADTLLGVYDRDVEVTIDGEARPMPFEQVLRIGIIANEMIVNSIKYGFDGTADAAIHMIFEEEENFYRFTYHDSNTRPVDTAKLREGRSLGVRLIEMMVQQMDAQMDLNGQTGLHYTLRIPKDVH